MESALDILKKFVDDVRNGKVPDSRLHFGAPWRHPPRSNDPSKSLLWAKINLMDFVQSLVNAHFGVMLCYHFLVCHIINNTYTFHLSTLKLGCHFRYKISFFELKCDAYKVQKSLFCVLMQ